ncbi:hypothetical protein M1316_00265 [Candidatus Parvarchaeota archaeon]|nr:hypothetical protein [Candidatus Parvarchaeota archaeon]
MEIDVNNFSLNKTLASGQTFVWKNTGDYWVSFVNKPVAIRQPSENKLEFYGASKDEIKKLLGLSDDITSIKAELDKDDFLDKAIEYSNGLRVVSDGLWPATLSFILSIQSNIPLILKRINNLSAAYGKPAKIINKEIHQFPTYIDILESGGEKLKQFKLGFRTKFVFSAAEYFSTHILSEKLELNQLKKHLLEIKGVGDKVLDCILLYGIHDLSAFPMDVWMLRVLSKHYGNLLGKAKSYRSKREVMTAYLGKYAGYAQLYIQLYSRLNKIK